MIKVNTKFDGGSIQIVDIASPKNLRFKIRPDTNSHFAQWFYFSLTGVKEKDLKITLEDLKNTAYPDGWKNYNVVTSVDNSSWFRTKSSFDGNKLTFQITPTTDRVYFAYFEPYSYQRHVELINGAMQSENVNYELLGVTAEGRPIDLLVIGDTAAEHKIWITSRQHPGETMAEWFVEGLVDKLIDSSDAVSKKLLEDCVFYVVPNMNPDGAYHGNLRVNSTGTNLNREWLNPTIEKSPEVFFTQKKMIATGIDMFFDIHGDEAIPYVFTAGCDDNKSFNQKQKDLHAQFDSFFTMINPDYQTMHGYEKGHFTKDTPTLGTNWVGDKFDCLALTLEMPFKDNDNLPDELQGWDGQRSYNMGQSLLIAINCLLTTNAK